MNIGKEFRGPGRLIQPSSGLVWRRKHGRGTWFKPADRSVWTLTPVAPR